MKTLDREQFPALSTSIHWGIVEAEFRLNDIVDETLVRQCEYHPVCRGTSGYFSDR